ncbi:hypothetical protein CJJ23_04610 [Mycoplasmopsis agassizii]|uniref:Transmembrane protein n=1 Tax=Mycoplasmopsis agassizii TaxID=33922 RepID=A0A269THJ4_9BACT|nr:hypothetical protein [Mycoplasmopsis agassizii]PAK20943.1 hypothetical protein CJJ23_04610 [Mycoplasmopsis agassizii]
MKSKSKKTSKFEKFDFKSSLIRLIPRTKFELSTKLIKYSLVILFFIFTLVTLFELSNIFFNAETIGITNILKSTNDVVQYQNISYIVRSTTLTIAFLTLILSNYQSVDKFNKKLYQVWLWSMSNLMAAIVIMFVFFFYKEISIYVSFSLSFFLLVNLFWSFLHFMIVERKYLQASPVNKNKLIMIYISYASKLISLIIFYVLFSRLIYGSNEGENVFSNNAIITFFDELFIYISEWYNVIYVLLIVSGLFILLIAVNLHNIFYFKESSLINNYWKFLLVFSATASLAMFIWFSTLAFGNFPTLVAIFVNVQQKYSVLYLALAIDFIILLFFVMIKILRIKIFEGNIYGNIFMQFMIFIIWTVALIVTSLNRNFDDENYKIFWLGMTTNLLIILINFIDFRKAKLIDKRNYFALASQMILLFIVASVMGYRIYLRNNNNYIDTDSDFISLLVKFEIALSVLSTVIILILFANYSQLASKIAIRIDRKIAKEEKVLNKNKTRFKSKNKASEKQIINAPKSRIK